MEHVIKVKLTGKSGDYTKLKQNLNEAMNKKILPDVEEFLTSALLYRNIKGLGNGSIVKSLGEFRSAHAGLITLGILDHVNKNNINLGVERGEYKSSATITKSDHNLIVDFKLTLKTPTDVNITTQTIVAKTFNPTFVDDIFKKAATSLKDK